MAWFMDTYSMYQGQTVSEIVTGKPVDCGGTVGRREATGRGVAYLIGRAMDLLEMDPGSATAIIQGYGNVGAVTAAALMQRGVKIVGVSDHTAAYYDPRGLNVADLDAYVAKNRVLRGYSREVKIDPDNLLIQPCDILVPAAMERAITIDNAGSLKCRILAEGANGPTTPEADAVLEARGDVFVLPDILCNSGGVVVSYFEWVQGLQQFFWDEVEILEKLDRVLERSFQRVLHRAKQDQISNRNAALAIGVEIVRQSKITRGLFP